MSIDNSKDNKKWKDLWLKHEIYKSTDKDKRKKRYILVEFPYPSGERLHVGHARSYTCLDAVARKHRMQGENVLFPFGWDAFGLPAENYALKSGIHPRVTTAMNITNSKEQAISWGLSFDWNREINTTDPEYYKWTQWIFVQMFKHGLAYKSEIAVNWCPSCKINLANEEVIDGKCERCGTETERRLQKQWLLRITQYADRLISDLEKVDYREDIKHQQINWIGRKAGALIKFQIAESDHDVEVFTTRPETIYGVTYLAVAPEYAESLPWVQNRSKKEQVFEYVRKVMRMSERSRKQEKEKTGMETGFKALNPVNGEKIPVWVCDYVMTDVGTGAIMGVPAHDERDFKFAHKHNLPIRQVVAGGDVSHEAYEGEGKAMNSELIQGLETGEAAARILGWLEEKGAGKLSYSLHLRDWVFSRQHYWGEPIPMVFCPKCAGQGKSWFTTREAQEKIRNANIEVPNKHKALELTKTLEQRILNLEFTAGMAGWYPVPEEVLPVKLPEVEKYQPTQTGESPLANVISWVETKCPECGGKASRETDTMPNWAGSSWYYLRYCDPHNDKSLADKDKLAYWLPVDWYNGGMEHVTLHLLYSRFWHKFLYDIGAVPTDEPYHKRTSHGVILGPDRRKMSKSKGNVINPDDVVNKYGADTLRMYEMFIGPFEQMVSWSWEGVEGVNRYLKRVRVLAEDTLSSRRKTGSNQAWARINRLIVRIDKDLEEMKFNTAVAAMMEYTNWWMDHKDDMGLDGLEIYIKLLAPMAPFLAEETYQRLRETTANQDNLNKNEFTSVHLQSWPKADASVTPEENVTVVVQINGKLRDRVEIPGEKTNDRNYIEKIVLDREKVKVKLPEKYKIIFIPGKIINIVGV